MHYLNKVMLIGNVCSEINFFESNGYPRANVRMATNRTWKDKQGVKKTEAEYHEVIAWGGLARLCQEKLHIGKSLFVEGYLKTRAYEKDGVKRYQTEIVMENMIMLSKEDATQLQEDSMGDPAAELEAVGV